MSKLNQWLGDGKYLPTFMRDFHDQKDVFKSVWEIVERRKNKDPSHGFGDMTWVGAHIFTIDVFLWFMAAHGWTLQRTRQPTVPLEFADLDETIRERRDREAEQLTALLKRPEKDPAQNYDANGSPT